MSPRRALEIISFNIRLRQEYFLLRQEHAQREIIKTPLSEQITDLRQQKGTAAGDMNHFPRVSI